MPPEATIARCLSVRGIVQGVGFRPFIFQLAHRHGLAGEVANTSSGVMIRVEGLPDAVDRFIAAIAADAPPLARITDIAEAPDLPTGRTDFVIVASQRETSRNTLISPDVAVCEDCVRELFDPGDRRYRYPFINCTNCGPRYTIIDDVPYDRRHTSMRHFILCGDCQREYDDPMNRRFHAQPNACAVCGPRVALFDDWGQPVAGGDPIRTAAQKLRHGDILAIKGLGGFHLAVDATSEAAVTRLRERKHREEKPFALMVADTAGAMAIANLRAEDIALLTAPQRPIVLVEKKAGQGIAESAAPRNRFFGIMLPYTPLHHLLLAEGFKALVMTSANLSEEPICIDNAEAFSRLDNIADWHLNHNRDIYLRTDDTIVRHSADRVRLIRRSRGYVPIPVFLKRRQPPVLACGALLKNTVCLTRGDQAFLSQHIGDLENAETLSFLELTVRHLQRILDITPELVAHDLHPDYLSTQFALAFEWARPVGVQHHHAHIVSAMAEHHLDGPVLGLSFDGTGYGTDGNSWGGEVLAATPARFTRLAHLDTVAMPGSNAAIREPWRMAVSYLLRTYGEGFVDRPLPMLETLDPVALQTVTAMVQKGFNAPQTSSMGRLFDAVAAIAGIRNRVRHEGQAAMELEMAADRTVTAAYDHDWVSDGDLYRILPEPIIRGVVADVIAGIPIPVVSMAFHNTLVVLFTALCRQLRSDTGISQVVMSGGVFQNAILLGGLMRSLEKEGFAVYSQERVPANDGGLSLGQAVAAAAMVAEGLID
ncbi:MAG: carbamoyltransferase HypF [Pseudomonadota bacterium]